MVLFVAEMIGPADGGHEVRVRVPANPDPEDRARGMTTGSPNAGSTHSYPSPWNPVGRAVRLHGSDDEPEVVLGRPQLEPTRRVEAQRVVVVDLHLERHLARTPVARLDADLIEHHTSDAPAA